MAERTFKVCKKHGCSEHVYEGAARHLRCMRCRADSVAKHRRNRKAKLVELFGGACKACGYDKHQGCLDFHHLDRKTKQFTISSRGICRSWEASVNEAKKCVLLCCRCHKEVELGILEINPCWVSQR